MALASTPDAPYSSELLSKTKKEMEDLLSDPTILSKAKSFRLAFSSSALEDVGRYTDLVKTLDIIIRSGQCYGMPEEVKIVRETTTKLEDDLNEARNEMELGYTDNSSDNTRFVSMSSVGLRNIMRTSEDESIRMAAYKGLRSIGPFVCDHGFVEIVKLRNSLAKSLNFQDYYDYTVMNAEGFDKDALFKILDGLEKGTRPLMEEARKQLVMRHGKGALEPWNMGYLMAGSVIKKMDVYFPFSKSVEQFVRSYSALGITYSNAIMTLDLLDRKNKYSNGFCHWPVPAWVKPDGTWVPSQANFTSLADPTAVGSGFTALTTLMHEAGHAAHFANIKQPSPLFSQERAPTSVAYAENQSMFLDSLVGDAAWKAKYATDVDGNVIPFDIIEEEIRATHQFSVFTLRAMLAVSYFEKALYELPEEEVTSEKIQSLADEIEIAIQGGLSPRPMLSVPHLISDEASCYYQGYTMAEMSVHQTRKFFKDRYGYIVDNPSVGPTLKTAYWECGNSRPFLDLVKELTGCELSGDAWTAALKESVQDRVEREKKEYNDMIHKCSIRASSEEIDNIDLEIVVKFVDGDYVISDSASAKGGLLGACREFELFVASKVTANSS